MLHPDRLLPAEPGTRDIARRLYDASRTLPLVCPHGHYNPAVLAANRWPADAASQLVASDHYLLRLLYSHGVPLESLGATPADQVSGEVDGRAVWRELARHYHLFRGTPSKLWLDHTLSEVVGVADPLTPETADGVYDALSARLDEEAFRPRSFLDRCGVQFLATTDGALDALESHTALRTSDWDGRVVPTFRPDDVIDPDRPGFRDRVVMLAELTGADTSTWGGYLEALRIRRGCFVAAGATATDHGHPSALTCDLSVGEAADLFGRVIGGNPRPGDAECFRGQMLVEMAAMSMDDGLVLQLHTGSWRNHNRALAARFGPDMGADIPTRADYVHALKPLLDRFGNEPGLTVVLYTLDESTYGRELAPLAGHYPVLRLGPPWWFYDSPEGMRRYYRQVTETAGFANTVGFNDDARSLLSIPARHDVARRVNAGYLAELVAEHRLTEDEAADLAVDLAHRLAAETFMRQGW